jgi:hypothetical protein
MIVPGGGISLDGEGWIVSWAGFFLPTRRWISGCAAGGGVFSNMNHLLVGVEC